MQDGGQGGSTEFRILRCVDWLQKRGMEVNQELWDGVYDLAQHAKQQRVRLRARAMLLDRIDPIPKAVPDVQVTVPVLIRWATDGERSSFPTLPDRSSAPSTTPLPSNGHALPSSSATDDLASL